MLIAPALVADTLILIGIFGFVGLFLGLAFLRLFVPDAHWLHVASHRLEGHLEFGGQAQGRGLPDAADCDADSGDGD